MEMYYGIVVKLLVEMGMTEVDVDEVIVFTEILKEAGYEELYGCLQVRKMFYDLHRS